MHCQCGHHEIWSYVSLTDRFLTSDSKSTAKIISRRNIFHEITFFFTTIAPSGFPPWDIRFAFQGQSRATQPAMHTGCFSVSIIHGTLTWTTGSLTCAQMLMHVTAHGGVRTHVRESALKVDCGRKIPCRTGESNLRQRRAGPML